MPDALEDEARRPRESPQPQKSKAKSAAPETDKSADAARRQAERAAQDDSGPEPLTSPEERAETIKKLEEVESDARFSGGPPTVRERGVAQLAHALIVRENASLRAHEMEQSWRESAKRKAAQFLAAQAAAAYRQLDAYSGYSSGALIH